MQLDLRKGEALLAVIESGSFEQAAQWLRLTPSAISQRIRALEDELGVPLLVRSRPCRPTRAGRRIALYLQRSRLLEQEWQAEMDESGEGWLTVPVAMNHDSLATWMFPAISDCLHRERLLLDMVLGDQSLTHELMESGAAVAAVSSQPLAIRGCVAEPLGVMRYRLYAAPAFIARYFPDGLTRERAREAPLIVFDHKDLLQWALLPELLGLHAEAFPCHHVPSSDPFLQVIVQGLGYGLMPEIQASAQQAEGHLVDLLPGRSVDVPLFWHRWRVQSLRLEALRDAVLAAAHRALLPPTVSPPRMTG
jgi:LysR family transcriptional regulator, chromosome initiation inhibitor